MLKKVFEIGLESYFSSPKIVTFEMEEKIMMRIRYKDETLEMPKPCTVDGYRVSGGGYLVVWGRDDKGWFWTDNLGPVISEKEE